MISNLTGINGNYTINASLQGSWMVVDNIAFNLESYYLWSVLILGFPGNCFTITTIIKMSPAHSLTVYIALLAIVDNLAIINKILMFYLTDQGVQIGVYGCKVLGFFGNFLITYANWILVGFSVERFTAVWFPFKIVEFWTFRKSITVVASIAVPLVALFLHLFWTMDYYYIKDTNDVFCKINEFYFFFMNYIWYWINVVVYALLPCSLLLIFNLLIIAGIRKSDRVHRFLHKNESKGQNGNTSGERQHQITVMLVTSAIALVVLTTPRCVLLILSPYLNPLNKSMEGATLYLIDTMAHVLCDSTHAINFYLYSFSSRRFRSQFLELMMCKKREHTSGSSHFITMSERYSTRKPATDKSTFSKNREIHKHV